MNGAEFIEGVRRKLKDDEKRDITDGHIADHLGITLQALSHWRNREVVTVRQMVGVLFRTKMKAVEHAEKKAIRPIVEFLKLDPTKDGARTDIFDIRNGDGNEHPYLRGLRDELDAHHGIYVFHDSRGRALYSGKARRQTLWREINNAYNRDRSVQQIRRVDHPERRQQFRTSDEKRRQIRLRSVPLHDLAAYLSAYHVVDGLIGELESLLIRAFANDLLNVRMENFSWDKQRST
jgi:hypothetical protein